MTDDGVDAEKYIISAMMRRREAVYEVLDIIQMDDFASPRHETIMRALCSLANMGDPTDVIALSNQLARDGELERIGGDAYLFSLTDYASTSYNAGFYAEIVHEQGRRRALAQAGDAIRMLADDPTVELGHTIEAARHQVDRAAGITRDESEDSLTTLEAVVAGIGHTVPALATPWPKLSEQIRGFRRGGLYIVGARPGVGKSVVALQCANALEAYGNVGYFTLEMGRREVMKRLISQNTGIAHSMIDGDNPLPDWAQARVDEWAATYNGNLLFDDRGSLTVGQMRATIRGWVRDYKLSGVVVDYLQLMTGDPRQPKIAQITEISRELKVMAREFDIPIIALSQLNRASEGRHDKRPALADLRESGSIEQDADVVLLLYRDTTDPDSELEIIVAKNRQGPTGNVHLGWEGGFMRAVA